MGGSSSDLMQKKFFTKYTMKETLGIGSTAIVKRCVRKSDSKSLAVKIVNKDKVANKPEELRLLKREIDIMHKIKHKHCMKYLEFFECEHRYYILMELLTGGELVERILEREGKFSEKEASDIVKTIAETLVYLHSVGIVHRDLKPHNLIYEDKKPTAQLKLTDFGFARFKKKNELMSTTCGTPDYVAPEILTPPVAYTEAVDVWSLGVITFILLCGYPPFFSETSKGLYSQIKKGEYEMEDKYWGDKTKYAKDLVKKMLMVNPKERITPKQILKHPWISGRRASTIAFDPKHMLEIKKMVARKKIIGVGRMAMFVTGLKEAVEQKYQINDTTAEK